MPDKNHKCAGVLRTSKGDRLLTLLVANRSHPEITETVLHMRQAVPEYAGMTDHQVMDRLETMIARIPKKCPECEGTGD